jgi:hypothetical protein
MEEQEIITTKELFIPCLSIMPNGNLVPKSKGWIFS